MHWACLKVARIIWDIVLKWEVHYKRDIVCIYFRKQLYKKESHVMQELFAYARFH